jgi:hypothetical protein
MDNEEKWKKLKGELTDWSEYIRKCFLESVNTRNSLLDEFIPTNNLI